MLNKIKQLQFNHIEQVVEMLRHYLCSSYIFVKRVCGQDLTIYCLSINHIKMTSMDIPK